MEFDKNPAESLNRLNTTDTQYGNKDDKRVIEGSEQETAKKLGKSKKGEVTRRDHSGIPYNVPSPDSDDIEIVTITPESTKSDHPDTPDRNDNRRYNKR